MVSPLRSYLAFSHCQRREANLTIEKWMVGRQSRAAARNRESRHRNGTLASPPRLDQHLYQYITTNQSVQSSLLLAANRQALLHQQNHRRGSIE